MEFTDCSMGFITKTFSNSARRRSGGPRPTTARSRHTPIKIGKQLIPEYSTNNNNMEKTTKTIKTYTPHITPD